MGRCNANPLNKAFVVTRKVPVEATAELIDVLSQLPGVDLASANNENRLIVRYDASQVGFSEIEQLLDDAGKPRPDSWLWRLQAEWFRFTDYNSRANAQATHTCCSHPPAQTGNRENGMK